MSVQVKNFETKSIKIGLRKNDPSKQAGSNHLRITLNSDDWKVDNTTIRMTIRDAHALKNFLNSNLTD
jgi:hypothetical protein